MKRKLKMFATALIAVAAMAVVYTAGWYHAKTGRRTALVDEAQAAGGVVKDPRGAAPDRYAYYPGTEALAKNEVRVIACGTGMPDARRGQAAACFLFQRGRELHQHRPETAILHAQSGQKLGLLAARRGAREILGNLNRLRGVEGFPILLAKADSHRDLPAFQPDPHLQAHRDPPPPATFGFFVLHIAGIG